jgi:hypothetical protein
MRTNGPSVSFWWSGRSRRPNTFRPLRTRRVLEDVAGALCRGDCHIELVDCVSKLVSVGHVDRLCFACRDSGPACAAARELSGIDLPDRAGGSLRVGGKQVRCRDAHRECEMAMAYGLRAGATALVRSRARGECSRFGRAPHCRDGERVLACPPISPTRPTRTTRCPCNDAALHRFGRSCLRRRARLTHQPSLRRGDGR